MPTGLPARFVRLAARRNLLYSNDLTPRTRPPFGTSSRGIRKKSEEAFLEAEASNSTAPFLLYEASLLIESGRAKDFGNLIVVTAPIEERALRIMRRDGVSREAALAMIHAQSPDSSRIPHADVLIENKGSMGDLRHEILKVLEQMKSP